MTIRIHLTSEDVTETRFAFSPVWEVVQSFHVLLKPSKYVFHLPWLSRHRGDLSALDLGPLAALIRPGSPYRPDFVTPPPEGPYPEFGEELERILATPPEQVRIEMRHLFPSDAEVPDEARPYVDDPPQALRSLTALLEDYWHVAVEPYWPRLRALLEGDVLYRARRLALEGPKALFEDLHPTVAYRDGVLTIDKSYECDVKPDGRGLVMIPLAFGCPSITTMTDPPWQPTIAYPPRGVATLWETGQTRDGEALEELLGETRASILRALDIPMTTSELAARLGVTAGAVSQQLGNLRRAGVVEAHRSGRGVYSSLTPLGQELVGLLEA